MRPRYSPDKIALWIVIAGMIWTNFHYSVWNNPKRVIANDVIMYYEYLPALFIEKDLSMSFRYQKPEVYQGKIWGETFPGPKVASKMTMGVALLMTPFFLTAHALAGPLGYPADGYTVPYRFMLVFSSLFYVGWGFWLLLRLLRKYFSYRACAVTILSVGLGTNLYYYSTIEAPMSHAYSFFLFSLFLWSLDTWLEKASWKGAALTGLAAGLIILVRPSNAVVLILVPAWLIGSGRALRSRFRFLVTHWNQAFIAGIIMSMAFLPQLAYWKYITGNFFYYAYGEERFFFTAPAFFQGLFSYRKGWLVYTPLMTFALAGLVVLYFRYRQLFWPVMVFLSVNLYILWSWWCWWYGGSFGQRAMVESYVLLSIPFAAAAEFVLNLKKYLRFALFLVLAALICLNIFQSFQYYKGIIHWDSMSRTAYWRLYFRTTVSPALYEQIEPPDYEAALRGER